VDAAGIEPGDLVVDVGAGRGAITAELVRRRAEVWAVEADPLLAAVLRERYEKRVRVVEADARRLNWPQRPFFVVASLPFGGATDILNSLLSDPGTLLRHAEVVVQWEFAAKRAAIWPSTLLGVVWGALYELRLVARLAPSAFAPPPSVDSAVLRAVRRPDPLVPAGALASYRTFVRRAFAARAPLRRVLPARAVKQLGDELGFAPDSFPRDLDVLQWAELFMRVRATS
jgi:23S rRNA (adenine-N6)-dimethyltransferase